jgi:hypothetical protein
LQQNLPRPDICNTLSTCGNKRGRIDAIPFDVTPGARYLALDQLV